MRSNRTGGVAGLAVAVLLACGPRASSPGESESADAGSSSDGSSTGGDTETGGEEGCTVVDAPTFLTETIRFASSPLGCALAFQSGVEGSLRRLEVTTLDLANTQTIASNEDARDYVFGFAPDTAVLVYREDDTTGSDLVVRSEGGGAQAITLASGVTTFELTSDGVWIVYVVGAGDDDETGEIWSAGVPPLGPPTLLSSHATLIDRMPFLAWSHGFHYSAAWDGSGGILIGEGGSEYPTLRWISMDAAKAIQIAENAVFFAQHPGTGRVFHATSEGPDSLTYRMGFPFETRAPEVVPIAPPDDPTYEWSPTAWFTPDGTRLVVEWVGSMGDAFTYGDTMQVVALAEPLSLEVELTPCAGFGPVYIADAGILCGGGNVGIVVRGFDLSETVVEPSSFASARIDVDRFVFEAEAEIRLLELVDAASPTTTSLVGGALDGHFREPMNHPLRWIRTSSGDGRSWGIFDLASDTHALTPGTDRPLDVAGDGRAVIYEGISVGPMPS